MGILDFVEEAAGAFGADKALEAVDPGAGFLAKAAAAVAGFEGVSALKDHLGGGDTAQDEGPPGDDQSNDGNEETDNT